MRLRSLAVPRLLATGAGAAPGLEGKTSPMRSLRAAVPTGILILLGCTPWAAAQTADLALSQTASPNPVAPGANLTFTLTIANLGPSAATNVTLASVFSPGLTPVSCSTSQGVTSCSALGNGASFGSIAPNASVEVTLVVNVPAAISNGSVVASAAAIAQSPSFTDPNPANDSVTTSVTVGSGSLATFLPSSLDFGNEGLHKLSAPRYVSLTNTGGSPLSLTSMTSATAEYGVSTDCQVPGALGPGGSCTITVRFRPSALGARTGSISVSDNAPSSPQTIVLSGTGVVSTVGLSDTDMTFGSRRVGTTGIPRTVTLTNHGSAPLALGSIGVDSGDFVLSESAGPCVFPGTVPASGSCTMTLAFAPRGSGTRRGAVTIAMADPASPLRIGLTGTGEAVQVSPRPLAFGDQTVGVVSGVQTETITVLGDTAVRFTGASLGGSEAADFALTSDGCTGVTVAGGSACSIGVTFAPTGVGLRRATLSLTDSDPGSAQVINVFGTGRRPVLTSLAIAPASPVLAVGSTVALEALATYNDGTNLDVTASAKWTSSRPAIATVGNVVGSKGIATGVAAGTSTITASFGGMSAQTTLTAFVVPRLAFGVQPGTTAVGAAIAPAVMVMVTDTNNHPIAGQTVAVAIGPSPPHPAALGGNTTRVTDATGKAVFSDLTLDYLGTPYTLVATAWTPGGPFSTTSAPFDETRVGDPCLGPSDSSSVRPVCREPGDPLYCADSDGDGLDDAWEMISGVDINGDGTITDASHDLLLPGADPDKPDIYVYYDWMDYGLDDDSCVVDSNCTARGSYHWGETCNSVGQCVYACSSDADCTSRTPATASHTGERCTSNVCEHTHDPLVLEPNTFQPVIDRFAAHGINLHILRGKAQPHSHVVSFRSDAQMDLSCEGGSVGAGTAGVGKYAVSFYDLKSTPDTFGVAHHYALFGHYAGCDSAAHCPANPGNVSNCPNTTMAFRQSGMAELEGNDLIISLGGLINDTGLPPHFQISATFMHELGHNLGIRHDGHKDEPCVLDPGICAADETCADTGDGQGQVCHQGADGILVGEESNYKPNYLSIMNYMYLKDGIPMASGVGDRTQLRCSVDSECGANGGFCLPTGAGTLPSCSATGYVCQVDSDCTLPGESCLPRPDGYCARLDYSEQALPTGGPTPGALDESNLDDTLGLGSGTADMFRYTDALCHLCPRLAPTTGPVNWGGDGVLTDPACNLYNIGPEVFTNPSVQSDIDSTNGVCALPPADLLHGHIDWPDVGGLPFVYAFQCNSTDNN